jgi:murein DD-endopeptidase MepM/ murein hydrolase activator NlpD
MELAVASPYPLAPVAPFHPELADPLSDTVAVKPAVPLAFQDGETLAGVLDGLGLEPAAAADVVSQLAPFVDPRRLRPDDTFGATSGPRGELERFELVLAGRGRAVAVREDSGAWRGSWHSFERSVVTRVVRGYLDGSLEASIREGGGEGMLAYQLSDVLQWDLDFNRDLREGDEFEILYEQVFLDGNFDSLGGVLAAIYHNQGRTLEAYRFGESGGYYDADGRPMRKLFLRSPLQFSRITSRFSQRRYHPILHTFRPHYGVDYGAPTGTPVRVTASGVVDFAGWDSGGGRMIKVRHPNGYLTGYLHLSKFASGVRPGARVTQGQVIGYVGSTGLATAPHLDYRVQVHGRWIDPLSLKSVPAEPLSGDLLPRFLAWRDALREALRDGSLPPDAWDPTTRVRTAAAADGAPSGETLGF